jgi:hypothetical protein
MQTIKSSIHPWKLVVQTITMTNDIIVIRFKLKETIMWVMSFTICKSFWTKQSKTQRKVEV